MSFTPFYVGEHCYCLQFLTSGYRILHVAILERQYTFVDPPEDLDSPRHSTSDINHRWIRFRVQNLDNAGESFWIAREFIYKTMEQAQDHARHFGIRAEYKNILAPMRARILNLEYAAALGV